MLCVIKHITSSWSKGRKVGGFVNLHTCGLKRSQTSTVKMVELLLNAEESEDIRAAIITAIIKPTNPTGSTLRTNLMKNERKRMIKLMSIIIEVYGSSGPGLGPGRGHCVVFLGKTLYSHGASLHPGV